VNVCTRTKSVVIYTISHMRGPAIGARLGCHTDFLDEGLAWGLVFTTSVAIFFMVRMGFTACMTFWNCYQDSGVYIS
jgi:hypothetical protein